MKLPSMIYTSRKKTVLQERFKGLMHTDLAGAEDLYDLCNLTSDSYPYLAPRPERWKILNGAVDALTAVGDVLYFVKDGKLCRSSYVELTENEYSMDYMASVEELADVDGIVVQIHVMGTYLILAPAMLVYETENGTLRSMGAAYEGDILISDGLLFGEEATANRLTIGSGTWEEHGFRTGDGISYTLTAGEVVYSGSAVIRSIDGAFADFYENSFADMAGVTGGTVKREVPQMDYLLVCNNRLFGCKRDSVYASKLGDPYNFNVFDGISTDSWFATSGGVGNFTAACEYLGYPYFFKADAIYKLYGNQPDGYSLSKTNAHGVKEGSDLSLAVVGDTLFYHSPAGVCAYTGGYPAVILTPAEMDGHAAPGGFAAGDGQKYYLRLIMKIGDPILWVFDTVRNLWHKEDGVVVPSAWNGYPGNGQRNLFGTSPDGVYIMGSPAFTLDQRNGTPQYIGHREGAVKSFAEFGRALHGTMKNKILWELMIRMEVSMGSAVTVSIAYDQGGYTEVYRRRYTEVGVVSVPIKPAECDSYKLKIEGSGEYKILAIARVYSENAKPYSRLC